MTHRSPAPAVFIFLILAAALSAEDFRLVYASGRVEARRQSGWAEISVGDAVAGGSEVRIGGETVAEFDGPSGTLFYSRPGTFRLDSTMPREEAAGGKGFFSIFGRILESLGRSEKRNNQAMGVRAESFASGPPLEMVDEDSLRFDAAAAAYARKEYDKAASILEKEIDPAVLRDETAYRRLLAASLYAAGRKGPALEAVRGYDPAESGPLFADYVLLKGMLLAESRDPAGAAAQFARFVKTAETDTDRQTGYYLLGSVLLAAGSGDAARTALREAVRIDADEEITRLARGLLE